jgi:hypothetical protein
LQEVSNATAGQFFTEHIRLSMLWHSFINKRDSIQIFGMKNTLKLYKGLVAFIIALIIANGYLVNQNASFKQRNRELLLQNDSLQSVNLLLLNSIDTTVSNKNKFITNSKLTVR